MPETPQRNSYQRRYAPPRFSIGNVPLAAALWTGGITGVWAWNYTTIPDVIALAVFAGPVAVRARAAGFTSIRVLDPWQATVVKDLTVTASPGKHDGGLRDVRDG